MKPPDPIHVYHKTSLYSDNMQTHIHHLYEIIIVEEGVAEFRIADKTYHVRKNDIIFISSLEKHAMQILQYPYKRTVITMTAEFAILTLKDPVLVSILTHRPTDFPYVFPLSDPLSEFIKQKTDELIREHELKDYFWLTRSSSILTDILIAIYRYNPRYFELVSHKEGAEVILQVQKYISEHFNEDITLQTLSEDFFFSRSYISRKFKSITGYNIKEYITLNRLSAAKDSLRRKEKSISQIAEEVGYATLNQFTRIFTQHEGKSPSAYRDEVIPALFFHDEIDYVKDQSEIP